MAEFAASLLALSEASICIGCALRNLIKTMKEAEDDIVYLALQFESNTNVTRILGDMIERYSESRSPQVYTIHSMLRKLIEHCQPIYRKVEKEMQRFDGPNGPPIPNAASGSLVLASTPHFDIRARAAWTRAKPLLEEALSRLKAIGHQLDMNMTAQYIDFLEHSRLEQTKL